ncbi:MFS transporter [Trypanosoma theileri]|uniref:MFS transporter n=1 Tax=Trypanosoma theileri TaxID=67003 RepID=A0A1X0P8S3_9TRYP|nr:MFS transporter [Trypanosoma theileri]ORC93326.1 MFS transporter [Trypanosoma theileri]
MNYEENLLSGSSSGDFRTSSPPIVPFTARECGSRVPGESTVAGSTMMGKDGIDLNNAAQSSFHRCTLSSTLSEYTPFISRRTSAPEQEKHHHHGSENGETRKSTLTELLLTPFESPVAGNDPRRFLVTLSYSMLAISNSMQWVTFSPVPNEVELFFHTTATEINYLASIYLIVYAFAVVMSCKAMESVGLKKSLNIAAVLNFIGATIKIIALYVFPRSPLLFCSQIINALAQVFIVAHPPTIANLWFNDKFRTAANATMTAAQNVGIAIGVILPTFFICGNKNSDKDDSKYMQILYKGFAQFFWTQLAIAIVALGMMVFLFPVRPKCAASLTASEAIQNDQQRSHRNRLNFRQRIIEKDLRRRRAQQKRQSQREKGGTTLPSNLPSPPVTSDIDVKSPSHDRLTSSVQENFSDSCNKWQSTTSTTNNNTTIVPSVSYASVNRELYMPLPDDDEIDDSLHEGITEEERLQRSLVSAVAVTVAESSTNNSTRESGCYTSENDLEEVILDLEAKLGRIREAELKFPKINVLGIVRDSFRVVRVNSSFAFMTLSSFLQLGLVWSLPTVIPQILSPLGVSESLAGWIGFVNLASGAITAPLLAPLLIGNRNNYKGALIGCVAVLLLSMSIMLLLLMYAVSLPQGPIREEHNNHAVVFIFFIGWGGIGGVFQNVMLPLMFEFGTELTFPVSQTITAAMTIWTGNAASFIFTEVFSFVLGLRPSIREAFISWCIVIVLTLLGGLSLLAVYPYRLREKHMANLAMLGVETRRASRNSIFDRCESLQ